MKQEKNYHNQINYNNIIYDENDKIHHPHIIKLKEQFITIINLLSDKYNMSKKEAVNKYFTNNVFENIEQHKLVLKKEIEDFLNDTE